MNTARRMLQALGLSSTPIEGEPGIPLGSYSADVQPPLRSSADALTVQRALGLPAVLRAIQLSAGMASQLIVKSWRERSDGTTELVRPQPSIVRQPDPWRELDSWIERFVVNLATDGNNFTRLHRMPDDSIAGLECLNPFVVAIGWKTVNGRRVKTYTYPDPATGRRIELPARDVIHTWFLEVPGLTRSLGPIGHTRAALTGVLDVRDYADRWFREESVDGVLTTDQRIDPEAARQAKTRWYTRDTDLDPAGPRVRVMGHGLKYEPIMLRPADAQWIEAQNFGILDVARIFGLPPEYLAAAVDGTAMTYSNLEMIDAQYLRTTLFPTYLRKIENALTIALPRGQRARFDTSALLRPDAKTRAEIDQIYLPLGVYDRTEVRQREGLAGPAPTMPATPAPTQQGAIQ